MEEIRSAVDRAMRILSIVKNYRSQFYCVITKFSYEELIKRIKAKAG